MDRIQQQHSRQNIPRDAIIMSKSEALSHQIEIVNKWKPRSDVYITITFYHYVFGLRTIFVFVWPLVYGRAILTGAAGLSSAYINQRFRRKIRLRDYGLLPTVMGITMASAAAAGFFHTEYILNKLVLLEVSCPFCIEYRSILLQNCTGLLLPLLLTPMANFSIAAGSGVYNVPHVTDVKKIFNVISSVYRPIILQIVTISALHTLLAGFITYSQVKSFLRMHDVQYLIEEEQKEQQHTLNKAF